MPKHWEGMFVLAALLALLVLMIVRMFRRRPVEPPVHRVPRSWIHWIAIILLAILVIGLVASIIDKEIRDDFFGERMNFLLLAGTVLYALADIRYYLGVLAGKEPPQPGPREEKRDALVNALLEDWAAKQVSEGGTPKQVSRSEPGGEKVKWDALDEAFATKQMPKGGPSEQKPE